MEAVYEKYFRDNLPHIWCPGCGNGIDHVGVERQLDIILAQLLYHALELHFGNLGYILP